MFLSRRLGCTIKYASGHVIDCHLNSYRLFRHLVNNKQCSQITSLTCPTCLYKDDSKKISSSSILSKVTTKGWKFKARDGKIPKELPNEACEEGKEAVKHTLLLAELQKCPTVASQVETLCSLLSLTPEEIKNRTDFCQYLKETFSIYFKNFKITVFGSSVNGLGFKGCDVDVCFNVFNEQDDYLPLREVPSLPSVLDGSTSQETLSRMTPKYLLEFIKRILRNHCPDINPNAIVHVNARCPILRFYDAKHDVFCDLSCENKNSVRNTMLLLLLCHLDERFSTVAKIVRYWGKIGGFVGDFETFNSYAFSLLVVHFLQTRNPPVLPPIQEIIKVSEYLQNRNVNDLDLLFKDLKSFPPSKNTQTAEELLKEFYFYFLTFDFSRVILLYTSGSIPIDSFSPKKTQGEAFEFGSVNMQDPFRHSFNVCGGVSFKNCKQFLYSCLKTYEAYQDDSLWLPKTENWGLCSIFHTPLILSQEIIKWNEKRSHNIDLPSIPDGPEKLISILQHGLLFHCTEFLTDNTDKELGIHTHFKLHCKAYHKTWQGREFIQNKESTKNCILEKEHFISKELISQSENRSKIFSEFDCECLEVRNDNSKLVLKLDFKDLFPPIVAVFLKNFIPSIFKKL